MALFWALHAMPRGRTWAAKRMAQMPCWEGIGENASDFTEYLGHAFQTSLGNAQLVEHVNGKWCPTSTPHYQGGMCLNCDHSLNLLPGLTLRIAYLIWAVLALLYFWERGPWHRSQNWEEAYLAFIYVMLFLVTAVWYCGQLMTIPVDFMMTLNIFLLLFFTVTSEMVTSTKCPWLPGFYGEHGARRKNQKHLPASHLGVYAVHVINESIPTWCSKDKAVSRAFAIKVLLLSMLAYLTLSVQSNHIATLVFFGTSGLLVFYLLIAVPLAAHKWRKVLRAVHAMENAVDQVINGDCNGDGSPNLDNLGCKKSVAYLLSKISLASVLMASSKILDMLCTDALEGELLDVTSKAIILDALQTKQMGWYHEQECVVKIIQSCKSSDLTLLKTLIDGSGGFQNFYKLVHSDITSKRLRNQIIEHVRYESDSYRAALGEPVATKVLSDLDDTLNCSGGAPAGADKQYPKKAVYPGCCPFYEAILGLTPELPEVNLVFLSARPHVYKNYAEAGSYAMFRTLNESDDPAGGPQLHTYPTLLPGQIASSTFGALCLLCMKNRSWRWVGEDKYETFKKYRQLYREYNFIFCGDDGQGDLLAGEMMIDEDLEDEEELGPHVTAVVIHCGPTGDERLSVTPPEERGPNWKEEMAARGLYLHKTYVGAAVDVHIRAPELMTAQEVAEIANKAVNTFDTLRYVYPDWDEENREEAEFELQEDLDRASVIAKKAGLSVQAIPRFAWEGSGGMDSLADQDDALE